MFIQILGLYPDSAFPRNEKSPAFTHCYFNNKLKLSVYEKSLWRFLDNSSFEAGPLESWMKKQRYENVHNMGTFKKHNLLMRLMLLIAI